MPDDTQRRALIRDLARRLELAGLGEIRVIDRVLTRLEQRREGLRRQPPAVTDELICVVILELAAEDHDRAALREAARLEMLGAPGDAAEFADDQHRTRVSSAPARIAETDIAGADPYDALELGGEG